MHVIGLITALASSRELSSHHDHQKSNSPSQVDCWQLSLFGGVVQVQQAFAYISTWLAAYHDHEHRCIIAFNGIS